MGKPQTQTSQRPQATAPRASSNGSDGFIDLSKREIDGWWTPQEGVTVEGILVEARVIADEDKPSGRRLLYLIELSNPVKGVTVNLDDGSKQQDGVLEPGKVLAVSENFDLRGLREYVEKFERLLVRLTPLHKKKLGKKTLWKFRTLVKPGPARQVALKLSDEVPISGATDEQEPIDKFF